MAGRRTWEALGRTIVQGERPIGVLAPTTNRRGFLLVPVYDVAQTEGRSLPSLQRTSSRPTRHVATLERAATRLGVEVAYLDLPEGVAGRSLGGRVEVSPRVRGVARVAVLAHELAHELLHQEERTKARTLKRPPPIRTRSERETEAEACAFVILTVLGLEAPNAQYVAWHGGSGALILRALGRVQRAARRILKAAEKEETCLAA